MVLSRKAGEGHNDIPMDVRKAAYDNNSDEYDDFPEGEHYLQLSQTERDMVDMVCSNFDNVIVFIMEQISLNLVSQMNILRLNLLYGAQEREMWDLMHLVKYFQVKSILPEKHRIHLL